MSAPAVFVLSLCVTGILAGCASAPETPQRTWRDVTRECYAAVEAGRQPTYQGRQGVAACDRYVEEQRYEEARQDAAMRQLLNDPQFFQFSPSPAPEVRCYNTVIGNQVQTRCR